MIEGVIFDFDDTIYNYNICNNNSLDKVFNYINNKFNIDYIMIKNNYDIINKCIKISNNYSNKFNKDIYFKQLLEKLYLPLIYLENIITIYNEEFINSIELSTNIIKFIEYLKLNNIKIGLLSNNNFRQQYNKLNKLKLLDYFDYIQTSDEIGYEKPNLLCFLNLINRMKINNEKILMIGDDYNNDIIPALQLNLIPFLFKNNNDNINYINNYFEFGNFNILQKFIEEYIKSENEIIYLSKLFGQSELNIQGQGGNISVKFNSNKLILIKSSGAILGNIDNNNGFCISDNVKCNMLLENNDNNLTKIFGSGKPSMETFFHCFMKKYTIHIHFTLSNIFLTTNKINILNNLDINYKIIDYYPPGIILANEIKKEYNTDIDIYFLKNHGLIITSNNIIDIEYIYIKIFNYFNKLLDYKYLDELDTFNINKYIYYKFYKTYVCRKYDINNINKIINIKYCFPDLAVYIQNIKLIDNLSDINNFDVIPDIIIFNNNVYVIANNLIKFYCINETLNKYNELCNNYDNLIILDNNFIKNMDQEKYRKNIII